MGNLLAVVVHAANIHDTKSGINPAKQAFEGTSINYMQRLIEIEKAVEIVCAVG